jgi:hypothetical protein
MTFLHDGMHLWSLQLGEIVGDEVLKNIVRQLLNPSRRVILSCQILEASTT